MLLFAFVSVRYSLALMVRRTRYALIFGTASALVSLYIFLEWWATGWAGWGLLPLLFSGCCFFCFCCGVHRTYLNGTVFQAGDIVLLSGLVGAMQHNRKKATISHYDEKNGWYVKLIGGSEELLAIKPSC